VTEKLMIFIAALALFACAQTATNTESSEARTGPEFSVTVADVLLLLVVLDGNRVADVSTASNMETATLTFSMTGMDEGGIMMSVKSQLSRKVKFDLYMVDYRGTHHYTSSCPVIAGGGVFEIWPHDIPEIVVKNIRVLDDSDSMGCM